MNRFCRFLIYSFLMINVAFGLPYDFSEEFITVTIPFDKTGFDGHNVHQNVHQKNDLEKIINLINENSDVTLKEMAYAIGKSVKTVQRVINDYGKIKYIGSSKSGHWEIEKE